MNYATVEFFSADLRFDAQWAAAVLQSAAGQHGVRLAFHVLCDDALAPDGEGSRCPECEAQVSPKLVTSEV